MRDELTAMIKKAKTIIENTNSPKSYTIGVNCSEEAGQHIIHVHCM
ncbi:HIT domain-containing protein [Flagellimonas lutimaris]